MSGHAWIEREVGFRTVLTILVPDISVHDHAMKFYTEIRHCYASLTRFHSGYVKCEKKLRLIR